MKLVMIDCVANGRPGAILANGEVPHLNVRFGPARSKLGCPTVCGAFLLPALKVSR